MYIYQTKGLLLLWVVSEFIIRQPVSRIHIIAEQGSCASFAAL